MKKMLPLLGLLVLAACTDYGKKVTPKDSKGEVYYKGDGVNEADAQKLADYLTGVVKYFDNTTRKSVRITKATGEGYDIRFVVNEKILNEKPEIADNYAELGAAISVDIFDNKPVNVFLADTHFKDIKSLPYDMEVVQRLKDRILQKQKTGENSSPETVPVSTEQMAKDSVQ